MCEEKKAENKENEVPEQISKPKLRKRKPKIGKNQEKEPKLPKKGSDLNPDAQKEVESE